MGVLGLFFDKIFLFIGMFVVVNLVLINMLMVSCLFYGLVW